MRIALTGIAASPGIVIGRAMLVLRAPAPMPRQSVSHGKQVPEEVARIRWATQVARNELEQARSTLEHELERESLAILDAHIAMLTDRAILDGAIARIEGRGFVAEWALVKTLAEIRDRLAAAEDEYLRARIDDIDFVEQQVLRHLTNEIEDGFAEVPPGRILVTREIFPTDAIALGKRNVAAFATDIGGRTSHTAVVARAMGIPAVVGLRRVTDAVRNEELLVIDGLDGVVIVDPSSAEITDYRRRIRARRDAVSKQRQRAQNPAATTDGHLITVRANIQTSDGTQFARKQGAEGVGLFRSEFLFMGVSEFPSEDLQYAAYRDALLSASPVTIRTLDLGGDKLPIPLGTSADVSGPLGLRGIRFSLHHRQIFRTQVRAILRASTHGSARLLFPMISGVEELRAAKALLAEVMDELRSEGLGFDVELPVGIMIEVPSAVVMARPLAAEADFFSIGTNDLIQYTLAIDRADEQVAYLYEPLNPAILRMIRDVVIAAEEARIPVAVCGEMAGDTRCIPILLGLGVREFSVNPLAIPNAKEAIRAASLVDGIALAREVLYCASVEEVVGLIEAQRDRDRG
jgi:phosphotransferase system enzyme I (PtsI)